MCAHCWLHEHHKWSGKTWWLDICHKGLRKSLKLDPRSNSKFCYHRPYSLNCSYQLIGQVGVACSEGTCFETCLGYQLFWLRGFMICLSLLKYWILPSNRPQVPSKSLVIHLLSSFHFIWFYITYWTSHYI